MRLEPGPMPEGGSLRLAIRIGSRTTQSRLRGSSAPKVDEFPSTAEDLNGVYEGDSKYLRNTPCRLSASGCRPSPNRSGPGPATGILAPRGLACLTQQEWDTAPRGLLATRHVPAQALHSTRLEISSTDKIERSIGREPDSTTSRPQKGSSREPVGREGSTRPPSRFPNHPRRLGVIRRMQES